MSSRVQIFVDLRLLAPEFASNISQAIAGKIKNLARGKVRIDTRNLQNTIQSIGVTRTRFIVVADTEYASAQEWGRPDLDSYGFTPYMEPSSKEVLMPQIFKPLVRKAFFGAIEKSRRRSR